MSRDEDIKEISKKYSKKLMRELGDEDTIDAVIDITTKKEGGHAITSREYNQFKDEIVPVHFNLYEKACNLSEKILKIAPSQKEAPEIQEAIDTCHLSITPTGASSFAMLGPIAFMFVGAFLSILLPGLFGGGPSLFFAVFFVFTGLIMMFPLKKVPQFIANNWRMEASNQMVLNIFYIVTYMRHTPNLELAIDFASNHLTGPLALDLKKVIWDIETEKYNSLKESLDNYLEKWRKWNVEYIEAMHLVESSLYESSEDRRLAMLDKSLDVILEGTFEKMLHYSHGLKGPITMLHMLGIVLPILGLVILPLVVSFMGGVKWYYLGTLYNIILPVGVYLLGKKILSQRPTGYGESDISEKNPEMNKFKYLIIKIGNSKIKISPMTACILIGAVFFLIAVSPLIMHLLAPGFDRGVGGEVKDLTACGYDYCLLDYREDPEDKFRIVGPFGIGSTLLSLFFPLAAAFSFGLYWRLKTTNIIKIREKTKALEKEFASALFQLGNRLGDNNPAEIAFGKVARVMEGTVSGSFFQHVHINISRLGMSVKDAIFNPKVGALIYFPSNIINSSMKVFIQSIKKGPKVAANSLINIARYIKEMHKVDERLKDLLAETISSMRSQISLLTPAIAGIVIGITSMITAILGKLGPVLSQAGGSGPQASGNLGINASITNIFGLGIPTYYFQLIVGLYVVQIVAILSILVNGIENGSDKLNEHYLIGKNVVTSTLIYVVIAVIVIIVFNVIAGSIINQDLMGSFASN